MVKVRIPAPLRKLTADQSSVDIDADSIEGLLNSLEEKFPGLKAKVCDEAGQLRRFVNIFVNGEDIRHLEGLKTTLKEGAEISIIPAIAGGLKNRILKSTCF